MFNRMRTAYPTAYANTTSRAMRTPMPLMRRTDDNRFPKAARVAYQLGALWLLARAFGSVAVRQQTSAYNFNMMSAGMHESYAMKAVGIILLI